jgi:hypothetical protein
MSTPTSSNFFVHGHCEKDEDIAYVVGGISRRDAAIIVATFIGRKLMVSKDYEKGRERWFLCDPAMKARDLFNEVENNMGSPRRSYEVTVVPFAMNKNLMEE